MKDPHKNAHEAYFNDPGKQKGDAANEAVKFGGKRAKSALAKPQVWNPDEGQKPKSTDGKMTESDGDDGSEWDVAPKY